jgi:hypothetical protein
MNKQQLLKYLKQMSRYITEEMAISEGLPKNSPFIIALEDAINVRDGLDMAIKFLEGEECH